MQDVLFIEMLSNLALIGIFFLMLILTILALIATIFFVKSIKSRVKTMKLLEKLLTAKEFSAEKTLLKECAEDIAEAGLSVREMTVKVVAGMVVKTAKETVAALNKDVPEEPDSDKKTDSETDENIPKTE